MHSEFAKYGTPTEKLAEECSELIKICMKIQRFGLDDYNPLKEPRITNREKLLNEIADVKLAVDNIQDWIASIPLGSHILRDQKNDLLET